MAEPWSSSQKCSLDEVSRLLPPGLITGIYGGANWIEWQDGTASGIRLVAVSKISEYRSDGSNPLLCVVDAGEYPGFELGCALECLLSRVRGIGLVSSRAGLLLRHSHRFLLAGALLRERTSGPFRARVSSPRLASSAGSLRLVEPSEVARSAMLTLGTPNPGPVARLLLDRFPGLQVDPAAVHLTLAGHHPEEILGLLKVEGVRVTASMVWYALLQEPPRLHRGAPAGRLEAPGSAKVRAG